MSIVRTVCPLNCPDCCSLLVEVSTRRIKVQGDPQAGVSGFICPKGRALGDSVFSPDRLLYPMLKKQESWQQISWEQAYNILTEKISQALVQAGPHAIFHLFDNGHNGMLKDLDRRFFQALGGVTEPRGDMCWGAGYHAQLRDFGAVYAGDWEEMLHSKVIILWGRDPAVTNKHLIPILRRAAEQGTHIVVINPLQIKSTVFAQEYIRVNPGTDGILALALCYLILRERRLNFDFVKDYVLNFGSFVTLVREYPPEKAAAITGVPVEVMESLAGRIALAGPVMFYLGYGLQRYVNGGNTVRAIDALAALSGNIGCPGGGVFYAHQYHKEHLNSVLLPAGSYQSRTFPHAVLAAELLKEETSPQIQVAFVTRTNPLVTQPDTNLWRKLWDLIPFKVTLERRWSETAALSDLVLPVTTIFEEEDLLATSWSTLLHYAQPVLKPRGEAKPEALIFTELARRLGLQSYFPYTPPEWLEYILEPWGEAGLTLEKLRQGPLRAPYIPQVAWEDKKFRTKSGKIELITKEEYLNSWLSPVENYFSRQGLGRTADAEQAEVITNKTNKNIVDFDYYRMRKYQGDPRGKEGYYVLLTPHPDMAMHSQFQEDQGFIAYLHPQTAAGHGIQNGEDIIVESERGKLVARASLSPAIHEQTVVIPEGSTLKSLGVNCLIPGRMSLLGENTAYYDTFCRIRRREQG